MAEKAGKKALSGYPLADLEQCLNPLPAFRSRQIFKWISRGAQSFQDMTDLPRPLREKLEGDFSLYSSAVSARLEDSDGTIKLQLALHDGARIEAVLLRDGGDRRTACLSTQAGCPMACAFCKTGTLGFQRNLDAGEMVEQFLHIRSIYPEIANIVIMGMGEPLLNLAELRRALAVFTDPGGLGISPRRITLSTCGIIDGIRDLAEGGPRVRLAVSLTTADEALRVRLMPAGRTNPLSALKEALLFYQEKQERRITLEAVLLGGLNTRQEDIEAMADFAGGLDAVINLIPWNPVEGMNFEGLPLREPSFRELNNFISQLEKRGLRVTRRFRKGRNIAGACGQLGILSGED
jgi:23S rRNA (adenine2503-C2)-methyltransferase